MVRLDRIAGIARSFTRLRAANREALFNSRILFATPYASRGWIVWFRIVRLGEGCLATRQLADEETFMRNRPFRACIAHFDALLARNDLEPEQRHDIERSRKRIKELARMKNPTKAEIFDCIREVSKELLDALM